MRSSWILRVKQLVRRLLPHPLYRAYRKRRIAHTIASYSARVVRHDYGGVRLCVKIADPLAEGWYDRDWPNPRELEELARSGALRPAATVFDLGAHQGVVALMLADRVGSEGKVVAVEAEPHNARIAAENVALNSADNVIVLTAAVCERMGTIRFAEGLNGQVDSDTRLGTVEVAATTIDDLAGRFGHPDLVFLDVEGYEGKALEGAAMTLASGRTSLFIEVHADRLVDWNVDRLLDRLEGFTLSVADSLADGAAGVFTRMSDVPTAPRFFLLATPASG
jgi:FkbM family methyltransferase